MKRTKLDMTSRETRRTKIEVPFGNQARRSRERGRKQKCTSGSRSRETRRTTTEVRFIRNRKSNRGKQVAKQETSREQVTRIVDTRTRHGEKN